MYKHFIPILSLILLLSACGDDDAIVTTNQPQSLCDSLDVLYTNDIAPILDNAGCSGSYCHGFGTAGITIKDYATTRASAENPKFLKAIKHEMSASPMPKNGLKLSDDDIQKIECWIQNGFKE
ncbi:cytochrome c [Bacteroidia bacterium]|nr:cytochrome c [Bacteroidia bacterium]